MKFVVIAAKGRVRRVGVKARLSDRTAPPTPTISADFVAIVA
jgi:hypothetical protein